MPIDPELPKRVRLCHATLAILDGMESPIDKLAGLWETARNEVELLTQHALATEDEIGRAHV